MTKSNDRVSDLVNGRASRQAEMHLVLISCIMTSPDAILPIFYEICYLQHDKMSA